MPSGVARAVGTRAGIVALYALASAVGRASVVGGDQQALVWPAGGVAVAWLMTRRSWREWVVDVPLLTAVGVSLALLTGFDAATVAVLATSGVVAVLTVVLAARWWDPVLRRGGPPTASPSAMAAFLVAVTLGSAAGVTVGAVGLQLIGTDLSLTGLVVWFGRNVCGVAAVGVTTLLIADRIRHGRHSAQGAGSLLELALLFGATAALIGVDYLSEMPVSFLLPAAAVWAGSRFTSLAAAVHALVGGAGVLWLTYFDQGPFSDLSSKPTSILLAQLFVAMTLTIGLVLASARDARATLQAHLLDHEREQSQELLTFARRAAHDLRNPLAVVESWATELTATLVPGEPTPEHTATMISGIERATARMRHLVDALLADAAARDRAPEHRTVDLPELVQEVAAEYDVAGAVRTHGVRTVSGDPVLLRQLVDNVVGNAVKYVRPGEPPEIVVSARRASDRIVVRVTDNGIGIPPGANEWIFEPFRRAHEHGYPGTGLGLSTCRRIVERHGGSMRALPREDGPGSVFEFDLPPSLASAGT